MPGREGYTWNIFKADSMLSRCFLSWRFLIALFLCSVLVIVVWISNENKLQIERQSDEGKFFVSLANCSDERGTNIYTSATTTTPQKTQMPSFPDIEEKWFKGGQLTENEEQLVLWAIRTNATFLKRIESHLQRALTDLTHGWHFLQEIRRQNLKLECQNILTQSHQNDAELRNSKLKEFYEVVGMIFHREKLDEKKVDQNVTTFMKKGGRNEQGGHHQQLSELVVQRQKLNNFLVDDANKFIYCYVPKVACTQWKKILMHSLNKTSLPLDQISGYDAHFQSYIPRLSNTTQYSISDVIAKLSTYTKFLVVRDPLERLYSAYLDKLSPTSSSDAKPFMATYGNVMIEEVRGVNLENGSDLTFEEMVKYMLIKKDSRSSFQEHWRPVYDLCHPCTVHFDHIVRFENLAYESEGLVQELFQSPNLHFPKVIKSHTSEKLRENLKSWYPELKEDVRLVFDNDYQLFGYS